MAAPMESMKSLMKKKDELESEIKALNDVLDSQKGVGTDGPLVDAEGFPRSDIDVYSVRHARHQLVCLQNDHKDLMKQIEEGLYQIHEEARQQRLEQGVESMEVDHVRPAEKPREPFGRIDRVDPGSPAANGGLEVGDEVLVFGSVTLDNVTDIQAIGSLLGHSENKPLSVTVRRKGKDVRLSLTPRRWSGKGLMGCKIVLLKR